MAMFEQGAAHFPSNDTNCPVLVIKKYLEKMEDVNRSEE